MRSRVSAEAVLRGALVGTLAWVLWHSLTPTPDPSYSRTVTTRNLSLALAEATRSARVTSLALDTDSLPSAAARDWLAALGRAGVAVSWSGSLPTLAAQAERTREPESRVRISVAADSGPSVALSDSAGALDSVRAGARGSVLVAPAVVGTVRAARGRFAATAAVPDAEPVRAVLVAARAGWEGKFVAAALQEAGWTVRSRQPAAPGVSVSDVALLPIDTAHYSVVIALDSSAAYLAPAMAGFAAQGGGLVVAAGAASLPPFVALSPARAGTRRAARGLLDADSVTRADLPGSALSLRGDAVRLEGEPSGAATVAVRRAGLGRVLTLGYDETWRWRMMGGATGISAHRDWWSHAVSMVAPEGPARATAGGAEAAPVAALISALGPARRQSSPPPVPDRAWIDYVAMLFLVAALLAETASRRFRGAP